MAELLDREFQHAILRGAYGAYPTAFNLAELKASDGALKVNVAYLDEHGLITAFYPNNYGRRIAPAAATITAKGIDFLAADGGLGAILGVVSVRLHEDTLKSLVETKIRESEISPKEKERFLDSLRELPADATKHMVLRLLDAGLSNWQKALPILQNLLA